MSNPSTLPSDTLDEILMADREASMQVLFDSAEEWQDGAMDKAIATKKFRSIHECTKQAIQNLLASQMAAARIELLERLHCCDNEPINEKDPINVCNGDHTGLLSALKEPKNDQ